MDARYSCGLVWLRRDLRTRDHAALFHALRNCERVRCVFVFDEPILQPLPRHDRRVEFIRASLAELAATLPGLIVSHARAVDEIPRLARELGVQAVFANRDYEPAALERDAQVRSLLARDGIALHEFKDQVIFERDELQTTSATAYTVFTPYKRAWLARLDNEPPALFESQMLLSPTGNSQSTRIPSLRELGFCETNLFDLGITAGESGGLRALADFMSRMDEYDRTRDYPALDCTSKLGIHLRFGTVSVRQLVTAAREQVRQRSAGAVSWLSELVWREFFFQILANFPHVVNHSFRPEYDRIEWESGERADELFTAWREGRTGFPIVDAAIAQINATGFMHNRLRMIAASFLVKDLGIDWRRGERWFAEKLNDYDLASNNGNWQWVASTGCDSQPYFRIFNPLLQQRRFDPDGAFVRQWLGGRAQITPIVVHELARKRTLRRYEAARNRARGTS